MRKLVFQSLLIFAIILTSCQNDNDDSPRREFLKNVWGKYIDKHFTCESSDFCWAERDDYYVGVIHRTPLTKGEFVKFYNLTDSCITMKYGNEDWSFVNLSNYSDNKINKIILRPSSALKTILSNDFTLEFRNEPNKTKCFFDGSFTDDFGYTYTITGDVYSQLIINLSVDYQLPFPTLRQFKNYNDIMDWRAMPFQFDKTNLKCSNSPILLRWTTSEWNGEIAQLFSDPANFLQLIMDIPISSAEDYQENLDEQVSVNKLSLISIMQKIFPGLSQQMAYEYDDRTGYPTGKSYPGLLYTGFNDKAMQISKVSKNYMYIMVDPLIVFEQYHKTRNRYLFANIFQSLLSEDRCYFKMKYKLVTSNINDQTKEREFEMALTDSQHSRNIMEYVILPLIIENRETIKEYIRQDAELSQHAETLCSAVDRLEEIYTGTIDLTLGYRLIENQWN